ncbi:MAG TPA: AI-2E family transporter [Thermoanaerobaculia bacterium]|nr:AI-2E family transporter [Thermoanaerobaculia bacterium]
MNPSPYDRTAARGGRPLPSDRRGADRRTSTTGIFGASVLIIAVLYFAKPVFIPIAVAILFSFVLRPIVGIIQRPLGRMAAVVITIALTVGLLVFGAWAFATQMTQLAREIALYSGELEAKVQRIQARTGGSLVLIERTLQRLAQSGETVEQPDMAVRVIPEQRSLGDRYRAIAPTFEILASSFLVIVLVFFLLKDREKLRDKILRLAGRANLTVTTQAMGEMTHRITRYIFTQALLNLGFGILVGLGLWALGLPHAFLWGVIAFMARFIPYVGAVVSAAFPILLAFAIFPDWVRPVAVALLFLVLDQLIGGFIEPLVVGHRVGVSPVAILVAAIFWGWLWGPVGLLLAVPITVCLTVGGEFIPALRPFSILFGKEAPLEGYLAFYGRLLSRDKAGVAAIADRFAEERSMEDAFAELFIPALSFASEERERDRITIAQDHFIKDSIRDMTGRLGDRNSTATAESPRVVVTSVGKERISLGTFMLAQVLRAEGWAMDFFTDLPEEELLRFIGETQPDAVFVSCSSDEHLAEGFALLSSVAARFGDKMVLGGGSAFSRRPVETRAAGANYIPESLHEAREEFLRSTRRLKRGTLLAG